ncbi:MAG: N-acetylmuramoyl-L-alanine amidase [Chthoniobacterales bacterium]
MRCAAFIFALLLMGFVSEAATWNVIKVGGRRYVPISDVAKFYRLGEDKSDRKTFKLSAEGREIRGTTGGRDLYINGVKYVLCFPMESRNGEVYLSAMDVTKIIEPVLRPGKIKDAERIKTIVLDAGHGGHDSGATGPLGLEKAYALDVVLRARELLLKDGYDVKLTRSKDVFVPLQERANFANKHDNALFFSVHFNKSSSSAATGIETYALAPRGVPSMDEENLSYSDFKENPGNAQDPQNVALAAAVHSAMVNNLQVPDRGIKRARFVVIKNIKIPGVLLEGGFMGSTRDAKLIASGEYRQKMAASILQAVRAFTRSVNGRVESAPPTLIVKGDDPTSVPSLETVEKTKKGPAVITPPEGIEPRPRPKVEKNKTPSAKEVAPTPVPPEPAAVPTPSMEKMKVDKWW